MHVFESVAKMEEELDEDVKEAEEEVVDDDARRVSNALRELLQFAKVRLIRSFMNPLNIILDN